MLGPRQVGKTTLIKHLLSGIEYVDYPLQNPSLKINMEKDQGLLIVGLLFIWLFFLGNGDMLLWFCR